MSGRPSPNRRRVDWNAVPAPMAVRDEILAACRAQIEGATRARLRRLLIPLVQRYLAAREIGEGYHWALTSRLVGARIGRFAYVGPGSDLSGPVVVGDLTMVSRNVSIFGADHEYDVPTVPMRLAFPAIARQPTIIEADCWIGQSAQLREGVRIRRGTVVAAGAVVTRDTEPYSIVAGVPAVTRRYRFSASQQRAHDSLLYGCRFDQPGRSEDATIVEPSTPAEVGGGS